MRGRYAVKSNTSAGEPVAPTGKARGNLCRSRHGLSAFVSVQGLAFGQSRSKWHKLPQSFGGLYGRIWTCICL